MAVEKDGFNLGEQAVVAIEVRPAGLHHADGWIGEVMNDLHEPVGGWDEVGVEDGDEVAFGDFEAFVERSGFVAVAVGAVNVDDGVAEGGVTRDDLLGDLLRFVGGVVEDLDFGSLSAGYCMAQMASRRRSMTNCSLYMGSWTVMRGSSSK